MNGLNSFLPNFEQPVVQEEEQSTNNVQPKKEYTPTTKNLGAAHALGGDPKVQRYNELNKPYVTEGVPKMLRAPMPQTIQALNEHPEYQARAAMMYEYARKNDRNKFTPDLDDPREIAEWATKNYAWLEWSDVKKALDYHKLNNMDTDTLQAWNEGAAMWRNTDGSADQALRATVGIATSPLTWIGIGAVGKGVAGVMPKMLFKYYEKLGTKIASKQALGMTALTAAEGATWAGADAAYWEKFESKAEGRDFDMTKPAVAAGVGAVAGAGLVGAGKLIAKGVHNAMRIYRGSELGGFGTETGRAPYWTDSMEAAANYAGAKGDVHVGQAYPKRPMIFNKEAYTAQEIIEKLDLDPEAGARLIEATDNEMEIPVKQVVDMVEDELKTKGVDMAIIREPVEGMDSMYGLDKGSLERGKVQSYKVLDPKIIHMPRDFDPMFVPRSQRGMVGSWYHGSGARHDKFLEKFLRTGEGNAVYGEGFYVAQRYGTAKWYADQLGDYKEPSMVLKEGMGDPQHKPALGAIQQRIDEMDPNGNKSTDAVLGYLERDLKVYSRILDQKKDNITPKLKKDLETARDNLKAGIDLMKAGKVEIDEGGGHLYKTEVKPEREEFLDWDKPYEEQSDIVKAGLDALGVGDKTKMIDDAVYEAGEHTAELESLLPSLRALGDDGASIGAALDRFQKAVAMDSKNLRPKAVELWRAADDIITGINQTKKGLVKSAKTFVDRNTGEPADMMDPNAMMADLPADVKEAVDLLDIMKYNVLESRRTFGEFEGKAGEKGGDIYNQLKYEHSTENIRDVLHSVGIKGNLYLDGMSRHKGEGSVNLVVFKEEDIAIRQRDDEVFKGYNPDEAKDWLKAKGVSKDPDGDFGFREDQDYVDLARQHGYDGAPYDPPWHIDKGRVSTRFPSGAKAMQDPHKEELHSGIEAMKMVPASFEKNMALVAKYPNFRSNAKTAAGRAKAMKEHIKSNLLWLHDQIPEDIRARSKQWYVGANKMANEWAERYDLPDHAVAGMMAVLSPQKDWYMNVSLAERAADILTHHQNTGWSEEMSAKGKHLFLEKLKEKGLDTKKKIQKYNDNANMLANVMGKKLSELDEPIEKAMWLRVYDETYHDRTHRIVTPEGTFGDRVQTLKQVDAKTGWGSLNEISKAVEIFQNPTIHQVSNSLGEMHKVRNFYNNIVDPSNNMDVTIDTHAVAAGLLRALSGDSLEVGHNFGSGKGSSSSTLSGAKGTYGLFAEAYREAAAERGILPREMQSITWEAIRGMYTAGFKNSDENVAFIDKIWDNYGKGKITIDEARELSREYAKGIDKPTWSDTSGSAPQLHEAEAPRTSYAGEISGAGVSGSGGYLGRSGSRGTGRNTSGTTPQSLTPSVMLGATAAGGAGALHFLPYSGQTEGEL